MKVEYNRYMDFLTLILGIFSVSFAVAYTLSVYRSKKLTKAFAKLLMSQAQLEQAQENFFKTTAAINDSDVHTQNFIKFLSDSRDWAFQYIEEVQNGLQKFVEEVEPQINHYNRYGAAIEGTMPPYDIALKKISKEMEDLKKFLPEETIDRR